MPPRLLFPSLLSLGVALACAWSGCSGAHDRGTSASSVEGTPTAARGRALSIKGSDTMVILTQRWADGYMRSHEGATLQVSGGGSGTGIAALLNGTTDIANASRPLRDRERESLRTSRGAEAHETRVALDALAVYVHADNPVRTITIAQLGDVFRGRITNWRELGGPDRAIVLYSRESSSGTYAYFKEQVLDDDDFATTAQTLPGTAAVISAVTRDPGGIGYGGIGYSAGVSVLSIAREAGGEAIEPTLANATSGRYPLARYLFMYTAGPPTGTAQDFIAWVLSPDGQHLVEETGFYPLPDLAAASEAGDETSGEHAAAAP